MEQQHQAGLHLVEFPLLPAEVEAHLEALLQGKVEGGRRRGGAFAPEGSDADRGGVPAEPGGGADGWFLQSVFEKLSDRHGGWAFPCLNSP